MRETAATQQEKAIAIGAFNAFVELWNRTPAADRHTSYFRSYSVQAGIFAGEAEDEVITLNPDLPWPIELLGPRKEVKHGQHLRSPRFRLPDGRTFDVRTKRGWRPFEAGSDQRRLLTADDVRRVWVVAQVPARR